MEIKKLKNNTIDLLKSLVKVVDYTLITFSLLGIIYIGLIIYYLNNLRNCECYKKISENNHSDIQFLIFIESLIFVLFLILGLIAYINLVQVGGSNKNNKYTLLSVFILFVILLVNIYFIYSVYRIFQNVDEECKCTKNWIRYLLYFQTIIIGFNSLSLVVKLFTR